jgi:hypothetical protein
MFLSGHVTGNPSLFKSGVISFSTEATTVGIRRSGKETLSSDVPAAVSVGLQ